MSAFLLSFLNVIVAFLQVPTPFKKLDVQRVFKVDFHKHHLQVEQILNSIKALALFQIAQKAFFDGFSVNRVQAFDVFGLMRFILFFLFDFG